MSVHGIDPLVSFNGIPFSPRSERGQPPEWQVRPVWARRKVAGSSTVKRQFMQYDADRLEVEALVPDATAYAALQDAIGTEATLTLIPEAVIIAPASRQFHRIGTDYVDFPATTLVTIEEPRRLRDGRALCTLVFEREHETGVI